MNTTVLTGFKPLFNGNIAAMAVNIGQFNRPLIYNYGYDQLNRLVAMDAYTGLNSSTNAWTPASTDDYKERISYDGNGNILTYLRNGTTLNSRPQTMDELTYGYNLDGGGRLLDNRLRHVKDAVSSGNYTTDIDDQGDDNYAYDEIGNLISDDQEGITSITWNVYGKISSISKSGPVTITYDYDASGNRIGKTVDGKHTWYVRDASGNVMAVYEDENSSINSGALSQIEVHLYGSARLGMWQANRNVASPPPPIETSLTGLVEGGVTVGQERGKKIFELSNHLGNVLVTISDRRVEHNTSGTTIDYYEASVVSASDYYPGWMLMPERFLSYRFYRYAINGQERTPEIGTNSTTAEFWQYDGRIMRRWNVDPRPNMAISPYNCFAGNPIWMTDKLGDTVINGQKMEPNDPNHATQLENVTVKSTYKHKPLAPIVESFYDDTRTVQNEVMARDIVFSIWNNSDIGRRVTSLMSRTPGVPNAEKLVRILSDKFAPNLFQTGEILIKNRDMPIDMAFEGIGLVNPYIALFNRTILSSMINERIMAVNLDIFEIIDASWDNVDRLNRAIVGSCSDKACFIKNDYLGVITLTVGVPKIRQF